MRAIDCELGHDKVHLTGEDDETLFSRVRQHAAEYHPDLEEDRLRSMMEELSYEE